jgi:hypothetical protein
MVIDKFRFENKDYVIALQDNNALVFYREEFDAFSWSEPILVASVTNDIAKPIKLLRLIAKKVKQFLYKNKVKYFYLTVEDDKRKRLYIRFLEKLAGYQYQVTNDTINVFKPTKSV